MSFRNERLLFFISLAVSLVAVLLIYVFGLESFSNPEQAEYIVRTLLYIFGLIAIRGLWKITLDNKIRSKKERQDEH